LKSRLYATPIAVEEAHDANELVASELWRNDPLLSASFQQQVDRFSRWSAAYVGASMLVAMWILSHSSLPSLAGHLLGWAAFLCLLPQVATRFLLGRKGYGSLGSHSRLVLLLTAARHLRRAPHRNELLVIPGMREDARSIFFVLSYWMK